MYCEVRGMEKASLIIETNDNKFKAVNLKEEGKKTSKLELHTIDAYTSNFNNKEELIKNLSHLNPDIIKDVYVLYNDKIQEIAYNNVETLAFLDVSNGKINNENKEFKKAFYNFLNNLENKEFYNYIINSNINNKLKKALKKRIESGDYNTMLLNEISLYLENYNTFRNIQILIIEYKLEIIKQLTYKNKTFFLKR